MDSRRVLHPTPMRDSATHISNHERLCNTHLRSPFWRHFEKQERRWYYLVLFVIYLCAVCDLPVCRLSWPVYPLRPHPSPSVTVSLADCLSVCPLLPSPPSLYHLATRPKPPPTQTQSQQLQLPQMTPQKRQLPISSTVSEFNSVRTHMHKYIMGV